VFGAWTAYQLHRAGATVILIDQYGPGNVRASSGGDTRIMRMGYGPDEVYTRSAQRSIEHWVKLYETSEQQLFHRTGVLWLARDDHDYCRQTLTTLEKTGGCFEKLTRAELEAAYPQIEFGPITWGIVEPESGVLMARRAVRHLVELATSKGVSFLADSVQSPQKDAALNSVATVGGKQIKAGTFVFACGPWLPKIFPDVLGDLIHVTRQEVFFFGASPGDQRFSPPAMPVWIDFNDLVYAIPDVEGRGFKIAIDAHGEEFDPDCGDRTGTTKGLEAARQYLSLRIPSLTAAPVLESQVCQYENTCNGDFLIDLHPSFANVWLVGGGSGHGFKHGPAVGEYVAKMIAGEREPESRFTLAAKVKTNSRQVY